MAKLKLNHINLFGWIGGIVGLILGILIFRNFVDSFWCTIIGIIFGGIIGFITNKIKK